MNKVTIKRIHQSDVTVGILNYKDFRCFTLELPDKGNQQNISCIPAGEYHCFKIISNTLGNCIEIQNVPGRTFIRIHKGNYTSQIQGCVLVGESLSDINDDLIIDVANSTKAFNNLMKATPEVFKLVIS